MTERRIVNEALLKAQGKSAEWKTSTCHPERPEGDEGSRKDKERTGELETRRKK
ncbi:MAG: hypothetical protein J7K39_03180 [Bacteroidales bacterium]|nr:hypothetical protein [Bacteroidales bacterium]